MSEVITAVVVAVIASSGLWGLIQFLIGRKDKTAEKIDETNKKIDKLTDVVMEVSERVDANSATNARTRILRFDDELINGIHHSREYFQQTMEEVDIYETYCEKHPNYKNNACVIAIQHIRRVYNKLLDEGGFIQ
jgi:outer membrane murein-binding lipoprotein Lpp